MTTTKIKTKATLKVKKLNENAQLPERGTKGAAGLDLYSTKKISLEGHTAKLISTGIAVEIPKGYYGQIFDRSSIASDLPIMVKAGVIDSDYRGEVKVLMVNHSPYPETIWPGTKIAQLVLLNTPEVLEVKEVEELSATKRGEKGFGSTN